MTIYATIPLVQPYQDLDGSPLDGGKLYFGIENQNPETAPITVYWDAAQTQPAAQPIRTVSGMPVRNGTIANIYAPSNYSLTVKDKNGVLIYSKPTSAYTLFGFLIALISSGGAALIGWIQSGAGAIYRTVQARLRDTIHVEDFGASTTASAATNLAAINAAIVEANARGGGVVSFNDFYTVSAAPTMKSNVTLQGQGKGTGWINSDVTDTWDSSGLIFGNYGTSEGATIATNIPSIFAEARYNVAAISAGARTVTCSTPGDAANFAAGDIVHIGSANMSSTGYEKYQMLNEVVSADAGTGVVTLKHKIVDAMAVQTTEGELYFSTATDKFTDGETLTGGTSGATAVILGVFMGSNIKYVGVNTIAAGPFVAGETVTGGTSGVTGVIAVGGVQLNPMIRKLNTGNVTGLDGDPAGVVVNAGLKDLSIQQTKTTGSAFQCVHFAGYDCDWSNLWITGIDGFGGNPLAFTKSRRVRVFHRRVGVELAYCVNNNDLNFEISRIADSATAFQSAFLTSEDGGADNKFDVVVTNEFGTVSTQAAVGIAKLRTKLTGSVVGGIGAGVALFGDADFSSVLGMHIEAPGTNGINCATESCDIGDNIVTKIPATFRGIRMTTLSKYCAVHDNILGDKTNPQTQDTILDDNGEPTTNIYSNNVGKISQPRRCEPQATVYQVAAETTLETYSVEANSAIVGEAWEVEWFGQVTGVNAQKDIRIKVAGTTIAIHTMAAGTTGAFYGRAIVATTSASSWSARGLQETAGVVAAITGSNGVANAFTNQTDIILTAQLANAADSIVLRYFAVTPKGDQFQG